MLVLLRMLKVLRNGGTTKNSEEEREGRADTNTLRLRTRLHERESRRWSLVNDMPRPWFKRLPSEEAVGDSRLNCYPYKAIETQKNGGEVLGGSVHTLHPFQPLSCPYAKPFLNAFVQDRTDIFWALLCAAVSLSIFFPLVCLFFYMSGFL